MPALSSTMTEGKIVSWIKTEGEKLAKGESVVVVESDKADMDVETFYDGYLAAIVVGEGETAPVGSAIGLLAETEAEIEEVKSKAASKSSSPAVSAEAVVPSPPPATSSPAPAIAQPAPVATVPDGPRRTIATPYAKKLAKQHKVDIESIAGTGPNGRITASDVEAAAGIAPSVAPPPPPPPAASPATATATAKATATNLPPLLPDSSVVPFTTMQSAVSKNMVESLSVPTFRVGYPVNTDALDALYEKVSNLSEIIARIVVMLCSIFACEIC